MMKHTEFNSNSQIKFKTLVLKSSLYDYSDAYILVNATITVLNTRANGANPNNRKNIVIKNCAPFTNCISKISHTQIDNAKDNVVMPMHNFMIEPVLCLNIKLKQQAEEEMMAKRMLK